MPPRAYPKTISRGSLQFSARLLVVRRLFVFKRRLWFSRRGTLSQFNHLFGQLIKRASDPKHLLRLFRHDLVQLLDESLLVSQCDFELLNAMLGVDHGTFENQGASVIFGSANR